MPAAPSTDWKEIVAPDEGERFERYAAQLGELQSQAARQGRVHRALHHKQNVGVRAQLIVRDDLPAEFRVGPFATARTFEACARFSNGAGRRQSDHRSDVRGFALKLLGVDGKKVIPGMESARTQDLLFIDTPTIPFRTADDFIFFVTGAQRPLTLLPRTFARFGFAGAVRLLKKLAASASRKTQSMAALQFWTAAPIRFGEYAAKLSLQPIDPPAPSADSPSPDFLGDDLIARLQRGPLRYQLLVQLYRDERTTPIEDPTVEWTDANAPFVCVAELLLPQQDLSSPDGARLQETIEKLSFDPWHALVEMRPLGEIMRARDVAYRASTRGRQAAGEPSGDSLEQADSLELHHRS